MKKTTYSDAKERLSVLQSRLNSVSAQLAEAEAACNQANVEAIVSGLGGASKSAQERVSALGAEKAGLEAEIKPFAPALEILRLQEEKEREKEERQRIEGIKQEYRAKLPELVAAACRLNCLFREATSIYNSLSQKHRHEVPFLNLDLKFNQEYGFTQWADFLCGCGYANLLPPDNVNRIRHEKSRNQ